MQSLFRAIVGLSAANLAAQLTSLAAGVVIARLYAPAEVGVYALSLSLATVIAIVASARLDSLVPLVRSERASRELFSDALSLAGIFCTGLFLLLGVDMLVAGWTGRLKMDAVVWIPVPFLTLALVWQTAAVQLAVRRRQYRGVARFRLGQALVMNGSQPLIGLLGYAQSTGLVLGDLLGRIGGVLSIPVGWSGLELRPGRAWSRVRRLRHLISTSMPAALLNSLSIQLPLFTFSIVADAGVVGNYSLAYRLLVAPVTLLASAVGQVFLGEASANRGDPRHLAALFQGTTRRMFLLGILPSALLWAVSPRLFPIVFGARWAEAGEFARWLTPVFFAQFVLSPVSQIFGLRRQFGSQLLWEIGRAIFTAVALGVATSRWGPLTGIKVYAAVAVALYFGLFVAYRKLTVSGQETAR